MVCLQTGTSEMPLWLTAETRVLARLRPRTLGGSRDWSGSPEAHRERRRELRREATIAERKLWNVLRGSSTGFKFRRQHSLGPYIADFYSRAAHLVVEIDGEGHYTAEGRAHDRRRDAFLRGLGLDVLRVPVTELDDNLEGVWLEIQRQCRLRAEGVGEGQWVQAGGLVVGDAVYGVRGNVRGKGCEGPASAGTASFDGGGVMTDGKPPLDPPANGGKVQGLSFFASGEGVLTGPPPPLDPPANGRREEVLAVVQFKGTTLWSVAGEWAEETVCGLTVDGGQAFATAAGVVDCGGCE